MIRARAVCAVRRHQPVRGNGPPYAESGPEIAELEPIPGPRPLPQDRSTAASTRPVHGRFHKAGPRPLPQDRSTAASTRPDLGGSGAGPYISCPHHHVGAGPPTPPVAPHPSDRGHRVRHRRLRRPADPGGHGLGRHLRLGARPPVSRRGRPQPGRCGSASYLRPWRVPATALRLGLVCPLLAVLRLCC